jgi:hypothetical protein
MKKIILLCFVLFAFSVVVNAQFIKAVSLSGGYARSATPLNSNNKVQYLSAPSSRLISTWGIETGLTFWQSKHFSFSTQVGFLQKGTAGYGLPYNQKFNPRIDYIFQSFRYYSNNIFIAPRIAFKYPIKKYTPYVFVNPRIDFEISSVSKNNEIKYKKSAQEIYDNSNSLPILGGNYGFGITRALNKRFSLGIELSNFLDFEYYVSTYGEYIDYKYTTKYKFITYAAYITLQYSFIKN